VNDQEQRVTHDGRGRLTEVFYQANGSTQETRHNLAGLVQSSSDEDNVTRSYTYEPLYGRMEKV
jgi:hypothetical protein